MSSDLNKEGKILVEGKPKHEIAQDSLRSLESTVDKLQDLLFVIRTGAIQPKESNEKPPILSLESFLDNLPEKLQEIEKKIEGLLSDIKTALF